MQPQHEGFPGQDPQGPRTIARSRSYYSAAIHDTGGQADPAERGYRPLHLTAMHGEAAGKAVQNTGVDVEKYPGNPKLAETREAMFTFAHELAAEFATDMNRKNNEYHQPNARLVTGETTSYTKTPRRFLGRLGLTKTAEQTTQQADDVWLIQRTPRTAKTAKIDEHGNKYVVPGEPILGAAMTGRLNLHKGAAYETGLAVTRDGRMVAYETIPARSDLAWSRQGAFFQDGHYQTPKDAGSDLYVKYLPLTPEGMFPNLLTINPNVPPTHQPGIIAIATLMNNIEHAANEAAKKAK